MKIPKLVYEDTTPEAFYEACRRHVGTTEPAFQLWDLVNIKGDFGRLTPAMVIGIESRQQDEWTYHLLRPRHYDGVLERVVDSGKNMTKL